MAALVAQVPLEQVPAVPLEQVPAVLLEQVPVVDLVADLVTADLVVDPVVAAVHPCLWMFHLTELPGLSVSAATLVLTLSSSPAGLR